MRVVQAERGVCMYVCIYVYLCTFIASTHTYTYIQYTCTPRWHAANGHQRRGKRAVSCRASSRASESRGAPARLSAAQARRDQRTNQSAQLLRHIPTGCRWVIRGTLSFEPGSEIYTCSQDRSRLSLVLLRNVRHSQNLIVLNTTRVWSVALESVPDRPGIGPIRTVSKVLVNSLLRIAKWTRKMRVIRKISTF